MRNFYEKLLFLRREHKRGLIRGCLILIAVDVMISAEIFGASSEIMDGEMHVSFFEKILSAFQHPLAMLILYFILFSLMYWGMTKLWYEEDTDDDPREFAESGEHGTARQMSDTEAENYYLVKDIDDENTKNTIIGWQNKNLRKVYTFDPEYTGLNEHMTVCATSGAGKTKSVVFPLIFQILRRGESFVVTDTSGEAAENLQGICRKKGYEVRIINFIDPIHSDGINPLTLFDYSRDPVQTAETIANLIAANCAEENYFSQATESFLSFLLVYVAKPWADKSEGGCSNDKNMRNLPALYQHALKSASELKKLLSTIDRQNPARIAAASWAESDSKHQEQTRMTVQAWMSALSIPSVVEMLSHNDTSLIAPGLKKCAYFISVPANVHSMNWLAAVIYSCMIDALANGVAYSQPGQRLPVPVNLIMDEFPSIFHMVNWSGVLNNVRKNRIHISMFFQSLQDIMRTYPYEYRTIFNVSHLNIFMGTNDAETAKFYSDWTGEATAYTERKTTFARGLLQAPTTAVSTTSTNALTPDMIMRLNEKRNSHYALIFAYGQHYKKVSTVYWADHPYYKECDSEPVINHIPQWKMDKGKADIEPEPPVLDSGLKGIPEGNDNQPGQNHNHNNPGDDGQAEKPYGDDSGKKPKTRDNTPKHHSPMSGF